MGEGTQASGRKKALDGMGGTNHDLTVDGHVGVVQSPTKIQKKTRVTRHYNASLPIKYRTMQDATR